jgi:hypothetical protein
MIDHKPAVAAVEMSQQTPTGQRSSISATAALEAKTYLSACKASPFIRPPTIERQVLKHS